MKIENTKIIILSVIDLCLMGIFILLIIGFRPVEGLTNYINVTNISTTHLAPIQKIPIPYNYSYELEQCNHNLDFFRFEYFELQRFNNNPELTFEEYNDLVDKWGAYYQEDISKYSKSKICQTVFKSDCVNERFKLIYGYLSDEFNYSSHTRKPKLSEALNKWKGDCTERAIILNELLRCNGFYSRIVHGYYSERKHDWVEVLYPADGWVYWRPIEEGEVLEGDGIW